MMKCSLCFQKFSDGNGLGHKPNLGELCCKYLHSALTQDNLSSQQNNQLFCPKCQESALQLAGFCEQLDFFQKCITELIFTFSLEILHRRGKRSDFEEAPEKRLIEFDVSALPGCNSWISSTFIDNSEVPESSARNSKTVTPENVYVGNIEIEDPLALSSLVGNETSSIIVEEIKTETNWIDESIYLGQEGNYTNEFPTQIERAQESLETPILKLQKLKFRGNGRKSVVVESDVDNAKCYSNQRKITTNVWTKKNPGGSYHRIKNHNSILPSQCVKTPKHFADTSIDEKLFTNTASSSFYQEEQIPTNPTNQGSGNSKPRSQNKSLKRKRHRQNRNSKKGNSSYQCHLCRREFTASHSLTRHMMIHSGELPFKCDICNRRFRHKHHLKAHRMKHTGEIFPCPHCLKTFDRTYSLKIHLQNQHPTSLPFQCATCGKGFTRKDALTKHISTHKQTVDFKCRDCEVCYKTSEEVEIHYKSVHFGLDFSEDCIVMMLKI